MRRCVIVSGAKIGDYAFAKSLLRDGDFNVFCDCGLRHMERLGIKADLIVGDFDSHEIPDTSAETIVLPREKDDTDTVFAVKTALARGFSEFLLVGAAGGRMDHTLGNISVLLMLDSLGCRAVLADDYSLMEVVSGDTAHIDGSWAYFSLLAVNGSARGVDIKNAKYPLENAEITGEYQYGISNETLPGRTAAVSVKEGRLLLVKVRGDILC